MLFEATIYVISRLGNPSWKFFFQGANNDPGSKARFETKTKYFFSTDRHKR